MGRKKIDKTGEINYNNFGSKMVITRYENAMDIDVYFPEYDWTFKGTRYNNFKNGNIACPYEKRTYGMGYIGEGKYKSRENGKLTKCYKTWIHMFQRCYDDKYHNEKPTYKDCNICEEWLCFQNFAKWYYKNYYEIEDKETHLDKDILYKGNKIYSPNTCIFVPSQINTLFVKCDKLRGDYPIGVSYHKRNKKFYAKCSVYDFKEKKIKRKHLGYYNTPEQAFKAYKEFKEKHIKEVADHYKEQIPNKLYNALYDYKVGIND